MSRQTGHCRAGDAGALGWLGLLLCEAVGETGGETGGESVRSMNSSLLNSVGEESSGLAGVPGSSSIRMAGPLSPLSTTDLKPRALYSANRDPPVASGSSRLISCNNDPKLKN